MDDLQKARGAVARAIDAVKAEIAAHPQGAAWRAQRPLERSLLLIDQALGQKRAGAARGGLARTATPDTGET